MQVALQIAPSQVAGQGLFAINDIPQGTVIGTYPGVPRTAKSMLQKAAVAPKCQQYVFQTSSGVWLDPTDAAGQLSQQPALLGLGWTTFDVSMAFVNEPPVGMSVNVQTVVDGSDHLDLKFEAICDIPTGSELFLDYGKNYDRSCYK